MDKPIEELTDRDLKLVTDSQETEAIKRYLGCKATDYDGFFVKVGDGDYEQVWGFEGIIPNNWKLAERLV